MREQQKILVVEDSMEMQLIISTALDEKYFVHCETNSAAALAALDISNYSLIILDIQLPDEDGFSLLAKIRLNHKHKKTAVFLITGKSKTSDKVMGFSLGADDYLVKPIDVLELQARVDAKLKKNKDESEYSNFVQKGPIRADLARQKLFIDLKNQEIEIELTTLEFRLLVFLIRRDEHILSRNQILDEVWPQAQVTDRTVDTHIYSLRKKLGKLGSCIESVPKIGYRFRLEQVKIAS